MCDDGFTPAINVSGVFTRSYRAEISMAQLEALLRKALNAPSSAYVDVDSYDGAVVTWSVTESVDG